MADERTTRYEALALQVRGLLSGEESDPVALMANVAAAIHSALPYASWTGFYRVVRPNLLRVGPFQGPVACVEIPFGRGVCGTAASSRETQLVEDVHAFPGHIACDASAASEIVVPVVDPASGALVAVLDIDSHQPAAFDAVDQGQLEALVALVAPHLAQPYPSVEQTVG